jgi:hypothetical protein
MKELIIILKEVVSPFFLCSFSVLVGAAIYIILRLTLLK